MIQGVSCGLGVYAACVRLVLLCGACWCGAAGFVCVLRVCVDHTHACASSIGFLTVV